MAVLRVIKEINNTDCLIGVVIENPDGMFWFNPRISGRRPSRKLRDKRQDCIPKWALDMADRIDEVA